MGVKRIAGVTAALIVTTIALSGCGGNTRFSSPEALRDAFVEAGGDCASENEVAEEMLSEGAHGIICGPPITMLIVFDSEDAKNRYLARSGDSDSPAYGGDRWVAISIDGATDVISKLGGSQVD